MTDDEMNINIDFVKLYNYLVIERIDDGTVNGKMTADILRVFGKYGIGVMEAAIIAIEIKAIMDKYEGGKSNE